MNPEEIRALIQEQMKGIAQSIVQEVRTSMEEAAKPKPKTEFTAFSEMLGRAAAIGHEAQAEVAGMYAAGSTREEIERKLFDLARGIKPDTKDTVSENDTDGTGMRVLQTGQHAEIKSFKQITDADFLAGLSNPSAFSLQ